MTDRETVTVSPTPELRTQVRLTLVRDGSACELARASLRMPAHDHASTTWSLFTTASSKQALPLV